MLIAIHRDTDHQDGYVDGWAECLAKREVDVRWVDLTAQNAVHQVQGCDGVMWHWGRTSEERPVYQILHVIEVCLGIPVVPNHGSLWHRHNKLSQYYLLEAAGVPMPKTWVFWSKQRAREWALQADYPKVFKLSVGERCRSVVRVSSAEGACRLIDRMFGPGIYSGQIEEHRAGRMPRNLQQLKALASRGKAAARYVALGQTPNSPLELGYVYFQEFVPGNDYKTGIIVTGDRAFGFLHFNGPNDFRSNGEKYDYDPSHVNLKCVQMAFDISERLSFYFMGYDFLLRHGEPVVLEIHVSKNKISGYWKRNLEWVSEPTSPQEAQVEGFLHSVCSEN